MVIIWKDVVGYEGEYMVSDDGRIKSFKSGEWVLLKQFINKTGYSRVNLMKNGKLKQVFVHRLVVGSFVGNIEGKHVNHKNGIKLDNRLENLELVSAKENADHAHNILGIWIEPILQLDRDTFEVLSIYKSLKDASEQTGIEDSSIARVCSGERNFAGNYSWIYYKDFNTENINRKRERIKTKGQEKWRKVYQIDPETYEIVNEFPSATIATRMTGVNGVIICASGHTQTAGGFKWVYADKLEEWLSAENPKQTNRS